MLEEANATNAFVMVETYKVIVLVVVNLYFYIRCGFKDDVEITFSTFTLDASDVYKFMFGSIVPKRQTMPVSL